MSSETTLFNYSDIFYMYFLNRDEVCVHKALFHSLVYVYAGVMHLEERGKRITVEAGECVFIRRDHRVFFTKEATEKDLFKGITMHFKRSFLREYQQTIMTDKPSSEIKPLKNSVIKMPKKPSIESLFMSLVPYFHSEEIPTDEVAKLKMTEGILLLLSLDNSFYPTLFDFTEPWKIDILEFLEQNYMYDLSMEEIAAFTGRSLSTFKRDFKKISHIPPQKWLIQKRLESAYDQLRNEGKRSGMSVLMSVLKTGHILQMLLKNISG